jgi:hypothetical protein
MQKIITFDSNASKRIAESVRFTEGLVANQSSGNWYQHRGGGATLQIGKTTVAWTKGTTATISVYAKGDRTATGDTAEVFNLFSDIEADKWVAFISGYLVAAECDTPAGA